MIGASDQIKNSRVMDMTERGLQRRLAVAMSVPELLDAACDAFDEILVVIRQHDHPASEYFVPMVMAGAAAGNGRDYLLWAPSLPPRSLSDGQEAETDQRPPTARAAASWLATLCDVLVSRLMCAAEVAREPGDRDACLGAAGHARELRSLMRGDGT
jgi:hypothetical protein